MSLFRLLPLTMVFALCLLISKTVHVVGDSYTLFASPANAEEKKEEKKDEKKDEKKEGEKSEEKKQAPAKPDLSKTADRPNNQLGGLRPDDRRFSPVELELLQQLSSRREALDKRESDILVRENLLTQTETRLDQKFTQMQGLKEELTKMIITYNDQEDAKVKGLVKIYESMKPKDAARIFDELEMPILLMVVDKMNEKRVAPIFASMDSKKAKQVTVELAELRRIQSEKLKEKQAMMSKPSPAADGSAPAPAPEPAPVPAPTSAPAAENPAEKPAEAPAAEKPAEKSAAEKPTETPAEKPTTEKPAVEKPAEAAKPETK